MTKQLPQTSQELGLSSVTAVNCGHPLPASAPEVAPWDSGAGSWSSYSSDLPSAPATSPSVGGPEQSPTPSLRLGLSGRSMEG